MELAAFLPTSPWRVALLALLPVVAMAAVLVPGAGQPTSYEASVRFPVRPAVGASTSVTDGQAAERVAKAARDPEVQGRSTVPLGPGGSVVAVRAGGVVTIRVQGRTSAEHARDAAVALGRAAAHHVYQDERDRAAARLAEAELQGQQARRDDAAARLVEIDAREAEIGLAVEAGAERGRAVPLLGLLARRAAMAGAVGLLAASVVIFGVGVVGRLLRTRTGGDGSGHDRDAAVASPRAAASARRAPGGGTDSGRQDVHLAASAPEHEDEVVVAAAQASR